MSSKEGIGFNSIAPFERTRLVRQLGTFGTLVCFFPPEVESRAAPPKAPMAIDFQEKVESRFM
jgi:hypothetical protein